MTYHDKLSSEFALRAGTDKEPRGICHPRIELHWSDKIFLARNYRGMHNDAHSTLVGYSSGQRGQTVNLLANAFEGSNPSPTTILVYSGTWFTL